MLLDVLKAKAVDKGLLRSEEEIDAEAETSATAAGATAKDRVDAAAAAIRVFLNIFIWL